MDPTTIGLCHLGGLGKTKGFEHLGGISQNCAKIDFKQLFFAKPRVEDSISEGKQSSVYIFVRFGFDKLEINNIIKSGNISK